MTPQDLNPDRPSPEALLQQAQKETRGKLRIFFGMAPGVGKTYAMLQSARQRKEEGVDVVVGIVETHGRVETEELLTGMEIIPRTEIDYKNHILTEMDLDAIIRRKPQLVLVDELAHTNAPGSRHAKRYQDIKEILENGIDVYTSLNVQHLESLNDVVAQITRVRVRETVPDSILEQAEINLVDLGPEELIRRLNDGKVYIPEQAQKAIQHFFAPGNLTALRELALRATAERVDDQMLSYMQAHAIKGPWPAGERVLVCISDNPISSKLVRSAKRSAERLHAKWAAVYVETGQHYQLSQVERERIADCIDLVERLGGEVVRLNGVDISDEIVKYSLQNNVTRIILGTSRKSVLRERMFGTVINRVLRKVDGIDVMVISGEEDKAGLGPAIRYKLKQGPVAAKQGIWPYTSVFLMIVLITAINAYLTDAIAYTNMLMLYLIPVLLAAIWYGLWPSLIASGISILFYKIFFSETIEMMNLPSPGDFLSMVLFLFVAVLASNLASRVSLQAHIATRGARLTASLYDFSRKLAGIGSLNDLLHGIVNHISGLVRAKTTLLLPQEDGRVVIKSSSPVEFTLNEGELAAAQWSFDNGKPAGMGTETLASLDKLFLPLNTSEGTVGVLVMFPEDVESFMDRDEQRLLNALIDQAAVAIERMEYSINVAKSQIRKLSDQLDHSDYQ